jgi:tRNA pseudouridine13 synthase
MKLKQQPEDFQVEELTRIIAGATGPFAFYRLEKRGWTTPDAIEVIRRRWGITPRRLSFGGLKDRHALTVQYLTIFHGPRRGLEQQGIRVEYLGQIESPYSSQDIDRNRFRMTVRELPSHTLPSAEAELTRLTTEGVPNYFDDQRFGSVS